MLINCTNFNNQDPSRVISTRCHFCRQLGTFETVKIPDLLIFEDVLADKKQQNYMLGQRRCPNPNCRAHIFFVHDLTSSSLITYPAERIDFDSTDIPPTILRSFEEALICHAHKCFVASAIMVRKTLEELCRDRGATGPNLKDRIKQLGTKVILPQELLDSLDDLRLLGNDAAHIESQNYDQVGQNEVEVAIEVTKEVLKAVFQYSSLMKRLRDLKKQPAL